MRYRISKPAEETSEALEVIAETDSIAVAALVMATDPAAWIYDRQTKKFL